MAKAKPRRERKPRRVGYRYEIDSNVRLSKAHKTKLLKWVSADPRFRRRRPTVPEVIAAARKGPLRGLIEMDRTAAAKKYWYERAQYLLRHINTIRIDLVINQQIGKSVRAFMPIKVEQSGRIPAENYVPASRVAGNAALRLTVLQKAHNDFVAWRARYEAYSEFLEAFQPVLDAYKALQPKRRQRGA